MGLDIKGNVVTGYWLPHYGESRMQNEFNFKIVTIRKGSLREITDGVKPEAVKGDKKEDNRKMKGSQHKSHGNASDYSDYGIQAYNEFVENMLEYGDSWEEAEERM